MSLLPKEVCYETVGRKTTGTLATEMADGAYTASFTYWAGHPGCWYKRNGDPGDPPEPAEIEIYNVARILPDGTPDPIPFPTTSLLMSLEERIMDQLENS